MKAKTAGLHNAGSLIKTMVLSAVLALTANRGAAEETVAQTKTAAGNPPNLVFIFSDQQSYDMLGCYGNEQIITPNIDLLASQGVLFNNCIANAPACSPYRGILLSGQHPLRSGALGNDVQMIPGNGKYFAEILRDAGYRTGYLGKWHLYGGDRNRPIPPGPYRYGFDDEFLSNNCTLLYDKERAYFWDADGNKQLYGDWEPFAQTRQALRFLDHNASKPFALFVSYHPPHNWEGAEKYRAPEELANLYDPDKIRVRPNCEDTPERREAYRGHMAMCTGLDQCVGQLMEKLEELGVAENTIVVYTSDHGDLLMSHGLGGNKGRAENESLHVPLVVRYPQGLKPRRSDLLIGSLDLMPTLLGLMKMKIPDSCEGVNLAEAIEQGNDDAVKSLPLFLLAHDWRGVYTPRYTYSFSIPTESPTWWNSPDAPPDNFNRLFDRQADPLEMRNLFHDPASQALRQDLQQQALAWMKKFGDEGWSYPDIVIRAMVPEDLEFDRRRELTRPGGQARLKGRPIDFLKQP
jgi:arylsulfatase A-like enzyme